MATIFFSLIKSEATDNVIFKTKEVTSVFLCVATIFLSAILVIRMFCFTQSVANHTAHQEATLNGILHEKAKFIAHKNNKNQIMNKEINLHIMIIAGGLCLVFLSLLSLSGLFSDELCISFEFLTN